MTDEVKILNSKEAIAALTSPTGVVYKAFRDGEANLWQARATREDEFGKVLPDMKRSQPVSGNFTSEPRCIEAIRRHLLVLWLKSDEEAEKRAAQAELRKSKAA